MIDHRPPSHDRLPRPVERSPTRRRPAWRRRGRRPAARHRRRRHRQDQHARAPGRPPDPSGRRPAAHPPDDLLPTRRGRDEAPHRAHRRRGPRRQGRHPDRRPHLGRHLPLRQRPHPARPRRRDRPRSRLHHPRPQRLRRPDEHGSAPARPVAHREPLPREGHVPRDLLAGGECLRAARDRAREQLPGLDRLGGRAEAAVRRLRRGQAEGAGARLRRPAALLGRDAVRPGGGRRSSARASTMSSSTSIRTPTGCRRRSCSG